MTGCTFPKHSKEDYCKQWSIDHGEDGLQKVHDITKFTCDISSGNTQQYTENCCNSTNSKIMFSISFFIIGCGSDVALVDIIRPNCIKCRNVSSHTAHK